MSAEILRQAAALMRERAAAARSGEWYADDADVLAAWAQPRPITTCDGSLTPEGNTANADHIASWHPAVALAVADWLERLHSFVTDFSEYDEDGELTAALDGGGDLSDWPEVDAALAVARAYLGADS